jgi:hypothetical protein
MEVSWVYVRTVAGYRCTPAASQSPLFAGSQKRLVSAVVS